MKWEAGASSKYLIYLCFSWNLCKSHLFDWLIMDYDLHVCLVADAAFCWLKINRNKNELWIWVLFRLRSFSNIRSAKFLWFLKCQRSTQSFHERMQLNGPFSLVVRSWIFLENEMKFLIFPFLWREVYWIGSFSILGLSQGLVGRKRLKELST